jgi:hypothetical protein
MYLSWRIWRIIWLANRPKAHHFPIAENILLGIVSGERIVRRGLIHARIIIPAALASVPFGFELVRVIMEPQVCSTIFLYRVFFKAGT